MNAKTRRPTQSTRAVAHFLLLPDARGRLCLLIRGSATLLGTVCAALLAVGCGGGDGGSSSSVEDVRACIEEAGLPVEAPQGLGGEEIGVEDTLKVTLSGNKEEGRPNGIIITFFDSEEAAAEQTDAERTFLEGAGAGGSVEQHGSIVVSVARSGNQKEFEQVQDCV